MTHVSNEDILKMFVLAALPLFLYYRSRIDMFLHSAFALIAMSFVMYMDLGRGYNNAVFASMLAFVLIVNINKLAALEKSGKSIPEILKLKRYDHVLILIFFAFWYFVKLVVFGKSFPY